MQIFTICNNYNCNFFTNCKKFLQNDSFLTYNTTENIYRCHQHRKTTLSNPGIKMNCTTYPLVIKGAVKPQCMFELDRHFTPTCRWLHSLLLFSDNGFVCWNKIYLFKTQYIDTHRYLYIARHKVLHYTTGICHCHVCCCGIAGGWRLQ